MIYEIIQFVHLCLKNHELLHFLNINNKLCELMCAVVW